MIWHLLAAALMAVALIFQLVTGGRRRALEANALRRHAGVSTLTDQEFSAGWVIIFALYALSIALPLVPTVPRALVVLIGAVWVVLGVVRLVRRRGKVGHFQVAIGALILAGIYL